MLSVHVPNEDEEWMQFEQSRLTQFTRIFPPEAVPGKDKDRGVDEDDGRGDEDNEEAEEEDPGKEDGRPVNGDKSTGADGASAAGDEKASKGSKAVPVEEILFQVCGIYNFKAEDFYFCLSRRYLYRTKDRPCGFATHCQIDPKQMLMPHLLPVFCLLSNRRSRGPLPFPRLCRARVRWAGKHHLNLWQRNPCANPLRPSLRLPSAFHRGLV